MDEDLGGLKEPCIRWSADPPRGRGNFWGLSRPFKSTGNLSSSTTYSVLNGVGKNSYKLLILMYCLETVQNKYLHWTLGTEWCVCVFRCTKCTDSEYPCKWCIKHHICTNHATSAEACEDDIMVTGKHVCIIMSIVSCLLSVHLVYCVLMSTLLFEYFHGFTHYHQELGGCYI